jgi:hypothetical protein
MDCRQNQSALTAAQKTAFVNAVLALKQRPSVMHPGAQSRYDDFVEIHLNAMMQAAMGFVSWGHQAPAFGPWHRVLLLKFEHELQAIDPSVWLPYWDWTVDRLPTSSLWQDTFLGPDGTGASGKVMSGPFAFDAGNWTIVVKDSPGDPNYLVRRMGQRADAPNLPTASQKNTAQGTTPYDTSPWADNSRDPNNSAQWGGYRIQLEIVLHNLVHRWAGGSMLLMASPNDPVFWLHHCNIDRLWAEWMRQNPGASPYLQATAVGVPPGHGLNDDMIFHESGQPAPWNDTWKPAMVLNHHAIGVWYDTDPPEVSLLTPSVAFADTETGATTYRPVEFQVSSCQQVTLQITSAVPAPFGVTTLGTQAVVPPGHTNNIGQLWISFTAGAVGSTPSAAITVHCVETGQSWTVTLSASVIAVKKAAVELVLDRSGSMIEDAGQGQTKTDKLRQASNILVTLMRDADGIGITSYDDTAQSVLGMIEVGAAGAGLGRDQAPPIITGSGLDPRGMTSIGAGLQTGAADLAAAAATPPYDVKALLVLTDGMENTPPMISAVSSGFSASTFAVGLGLPGNISTLALQQLAGNHNGYLLITGDLASGGDRFKLIKYFLQIHAGITNAAIVVDPVGELVYGAVHRVPFQLAEADIAADVVLLSPLAPWIEFALEDPGGDIIDYGVAAAEPTVDLVTRPDVAFYRMGLPALPGATQSHGGTWHALLALRRPRETARELASAALSLKALPYSLAVYARSNLLLQARAVQTDLRPGERVEIVASLKEYEVPVTGRAQVRAQVSRPDGSSFALELGEEEGGLFRGAFQTATPGVYPIRVLATGTTFAGAPFTREQTLTAVAIEGGGVDTGGGLIDWLDDRDERFCRLLECLLRHGLTPQMQKRLEKEGLNLKGLEKCIEAYCRGHRRPREGDLVSRPPELARTDVSRLAEEIVTQPAVRDLLARLAPDVAREMEAPLAEPEVVEQPEPERMRIERELPMFVIASEIPALEEFVASGEKEQPEAESEQAPHDEHRREESSPRSERPKRGRKKQDG